MLATVAAADSAKVQKKSTAFLFIAKRKHTLCTLYINRRANCVFYSISIFQNIVVYLLSGCPNDAQTPFCLTLMLLVANLANTKSCKNLKMNEILAHGYSFESTQ